MVIALSEQPRKCMNGCQRYAHEYKWRDILMNEKNSFDQTTIKILVLSYEPWDVTNSFGNSYRSIFNNIENIEIANIYCKYGQPNDSVVRRAFQITDKSIIRHIFKGTPSGREVMFKDNNDIVYDSLNKNQIKYVYFFRRHRFRIVFWVRDLIWMTGYWQSKELENFITDFAPDIIWIPIYYSVYLNQMALFLKEITGRPMIGYSSDDDYTLKQFSLSPLFWIERLIKRKYIKKTITSCDLLYVITEKQKKEFDKLFHKNSKILCKGADFSGRMPYHRPIKETIEIMFLGNLSDGRWKSILNVIDIIKLINEEEGRERFKLNVYSLTPLTPKIQHKINIQPFIPDKDINWAIQQADILLHVEPVKLSERLKFRLSFSTKIVSYLENASCILGYGGITGTMQYLIDTKIGIYANNKIKLYKALKFISDNPQIILKCQKRAWRCGMAKHEKKCIGKMVRLDLEQLLTS